MAFFAQVEKDTQHLTDVQLLQITRETDHLRETLARHRLEDKLADTHIQFHSLIDLGLGIGAKHDIYYKFAHDKPLSIELDRPSTVKPPLLKSQTRGKANHNHN